MDNQTVVAVNTKTYDKIIGVKHPFMLVLEKGELLLTASLNLLIMPKLPAQQFLESVVLLIQN